MVVVSAHNLSQVIGISSRLLCTIVMIEVD